MLSKKLSPLLLLIFICSISLSLADIMDTSKLVNYTGQSFEDMVFGTLKKETKYKDKEVDGTCQRDVPYVENVCEDVTLYNNVCRTVPGRNNCYNDPETVCNPVTNYRNECTSGPSRSECSYGPSRDVCTYGPSRDICTRGPSRNICTTGPSRNICTTGASREVCTRGASSRQCRTSPGREVCRNVNGNRVCRTTPGREVCRDVPGTRSCRTIPGSRSCRTVSGSRTCRTVPGERSCRSVRGDRRCHTVPGERYCRNVPGPTICRDVPYTDNNCTEVYRERCDWIAEHQACNNVPYTENVCNDITKSRSESYVCKKTVKDPYEVEVEKLTATVEATFKNSTENEPNINFNFSMAEDGVVSLLIEDKSDKPFIVLAKKRASDTTVKKEDEKQDDLKEKSLKVEYKFNMIDKERVLSAVTTAASDIVLTKSMISFTVPKVIIASKFFVRLKIIKTKDNEVIIDKEFSKELVIEELDGKTIAKIDLEELLVATDKKLKNKKKYLVSITTEVKLPGKVLNLDAGLLTKSVTQEVAVTK